MSHDWLDTPPAADPEVYGQRLSSRERSILTADLQSIFDSLGFTAAVLNGDSFPNLYSEELSYVRVAVNTNRGRVGRIAHAWGLTLKPLPASSEGINDATD